MNEFKLGLLVIIICLAFAIFLSWLPNRDNKLYEPDCSVVETLQGQEVVCQ